MLVLKQLLTFFKVRCLIEKCTEQVVLGKNILAYLCR
jgi:hypothetical protein